MLLGIVVCCLILLISYFVVGGREAARGAQSVTPSAHARHHHYSRRRESPALVKRASQCQRRLNEAVASRFPADGGRRVVECGQRASVSFKMCRPRPSLNAHTFRRHEASNRRPLFHRVAISCSASTSSMRPSRSSPPSRSSNLPATRSFFYLFFPRINICSFMLLCERDFV